MKGRENITGARFHHQEAVVNVPSKKEFPLVLSLPDDVSSARIVDSNHHVAGKTSVWGFLFKVFDQKPYEAD